jgi:hypothetical protein
MNAYASSCKIVAARYGLFIRCLCMATRGGAHVNNDRTWPGVGILVRDVNQDKLGRVMDRTQSLVWLRSPGGGREWTARLDEIEPADVADELSAKVAAANARSAGRIP